MCILYDVHPAPHNANFLEAEMAQDNDQYEDYDLDGYEDGFEDEEDRYKRQEMLPEFAGKQDLLAQKHVAIVGVGGLGGLCSVLLSNAGVGKLSLFDSDSIAWSNLHRQIIFTEEEAEALIASKINSVTKFITKRNSATRLTTSNGTVTSKTIEGLKNCDLVLDLTDNPESRADIARGALRAKIDLIEGAVSGYTGQVALFAFSQPDFVKKHGCYSCLVPEMYQPFKGITGPSAAYVSSLVAHIALAYLLGDNSMVGTLVRTDLQHLTMKKMQLQPDPKCPVCNFLQQLG